MRLLFVILALMLDIIPGGKAYMKQLQPRDSILIGDQIEYGFELDSLRKGVQVVVPDFTQASNDTLVVLGGWKVDTLSSGKPVSGDALRRLMGKDKPFGIRASVVLAPFEEGYYRLPDIMVGKSRNGKIDTLIIEGLEMAVKTMPVDTATFVIHDIKGQINYPVTFAEVAPWLFGGLALLALVALAAWLIRKAVMKKKGQVEVHADPAYIVALRELDKYRSDKFWAPEKQKAFYSGVTDALKFYMEDRFGVDAPEMTTAELFAALKSDRDITPELFSEMKDLFETADFVKFAKYVVSDEENSKVLPSAVKFVTSTYQVQLEEEQKDVL